MTNPMLTRLAFGDRFGDHPVFGMVHLRALPGAPLFDGSMDRLIDAALADARAICDGGEAAETLRMRAALAPHVLIFADHLVKHATPPPGADVVQTAKDLRLRGLADVVIVSGNETGAAADPNRLALLRDAIDAPLLIG